MTKGEVTKRKLKPDHPLGARAQLDSPNKFPLSVSYAWDVAGCGRAAPNFKVSKLTVRSDTVLPTFVYSFLACYQKVFHS